MRKKDKPMPAQEKLRDSWAGETPKVKSARAEAESRLKRSYNSKGTVAGDETHKRAAEQETKRSE